MLFLYDSLYNIKEETTVDFINGLFKVPKEEIYNIKNNKKALKGRWYIIDENTNENALHNFQNIYKRNDELWRDINGTNGLYQISNYGRIKMFNDSFPKGNIVPCYSKLNLRKKECNSLSDWNKSIIKHRRRFVLLNINGVLKEFSVSRLVAEHYLGIAYQLNFNSKDYLVMHRNNILYDDYFGNLYFEKIKSTKLRSN